MTIISLAAMSRGASGSLMLGTKHAERCRRQAGPCRQVRFSMWKLVARYEVRVQGGGANHRLFCLLQRNADDLGGPSIVCIGGLSKPVRSAADPRDYQMIRQYADEFRRRRTVYS